MCNKLFVFLVFQYLIQTINAAGCEIDPLTTDAPLLIQSNTVNIIYPSHGEKTVQFAKTKGVDFACPGSAVMLHGQKSQALVHATCVTGKYFEIHDKQYSWSQITCSGESVASARYTGNKCGEGKEAEIGFHLGDNRFLRTIMVCFDTTSQGTLYSHYEITSSIAGKAVGTPRPYFYEDSAFYHIGSEKVNSLYIRTGQRKTINKLLGLNSTSTKYIQNGLLYYLARGHMAARADFFYPAQENATFRYINAAPQWQTFNGYNWEEVEMSTRNYADTNKVDLQIWTGGYGITTLPHEETKKDVKLYLYADNGVTAIPVPAIYWKVVYNAKTHKAITLIGINNPYETHTDKYVICKDVSSEIKWIKWNRTSIVHGYSYACDHSDFRKVVNYAPNIEVSGLLI